MQKKWKQHENFYGADFDIQSMKDCIEHKKPCNWYKRSTNALLCEDCVNLLDKTRRGAVDSIEHSQGRMQPREVSGDKEKILPIDLYTEEFFQAVHRKYEEMSELYNQNKVIIDKKHNYFRVES